MGVVQGVMPQAARRTWTSRVSTGYVVMLLAGLLGVVLTLSVLRAADDRRPVLVAATDLVPGTVIDDASLRVAQIDAGDDVLATLFAPNDLDALRGQVAVAAVPAGALVTRDAVRAAEAGAATRAMSFPLPRARAVGGRIDAGDRVDVLAVERDGSRAGYVMADAEVLDVDGETGGPLGAPDELTITLAVDHDDAIGLAAALEAGTVTLVRATGAAPLADIDRFGFEAQASAPEGGNG